MLAPMQGAAAIEYVVAQGALPDLTRPLRTRFGAARVVDARRPKFDQNLP